jgi:hypothetical protein
MVIDHGTTNEIWRRYGNRLLSEISDDHYGNAFCILKQIGEPVIVPIEEDFLRQRERGDCLRFDPNYENQDLLILDDELPFSLLIKEGQCPKNYFSALVSGDGLFRELQLH